MSNTNFIVFLNKYDVFQNKIKTSNIGNYYENYKGILEADE